MTKQLVKVTDIPFEKGVFYFVVDSNGKCAVWKAERTGRKKKEVKK